MSRMMAARSSRASRGPKDIFVAQDVEEGTYPVAYDPDGRVFRIEAVGVSRWDPGKVAITPTGHTDAQALRDLIERTVLGTNSEDVPICELAQRLAPRIIC